MILCVAYVYSVWILLGNGMMPYGIHNDSCYALIVPDVMRLFDFACGT